MLMSITNVLAEKKPSMQLKNEFANEAFFRFFAS